MEINITKFYNEACPKDYSASYAEIGNGAGEATWQAAMNDSEEYMMLDDEEKREAFCEYVKTFGAWEPEEIAAWNDTEINALFIQMIGGDIRESCLDDDRNNWEGYYEMVDVGQCSGRMFKADDGEVYYMIGE